MVTALAIGQSPRMVLQEEFTSSTCGPCAGANPTFHTWLTAHPDIYTVIFWHCNWPSPGNDPMYLQNTIDNGYRISYYGVNSIPWAIVDGNVYDNVGNQLNWLTIQNRSAVPSPFEITVQHRLNTAEDSIFVTMLVRCTEAVAAPMVAENVVIEKHIHFTSAPGTNGEKDFYNVMKKMLPDKNGTAMAPGYEAGDYTVMEYGWKLANVYTNSELAAICFVQNTQTKEVYQAANSSADEIGMPFDNDAELLSVGNYSTLSCSGKISPVVEVRNNGNNILTGLAIKYRVNGEPESTYNWSGSLPKLGKITLTLPEYTFTPQESNTVQIYTVDPNNATDQYPKNDTASFIITEPAVTHDYMMVTVRTDNAPEETTWDVRAEDGTVIKTGGPYTQTLHMYKDTVYLPTAACYTFTIYDSGNNGICCGNGSGVYFISTSSPSTTIKTGNIFGSKEFTEFSMDWPQGMNDRKENGMAVYPNPFDGKATVSFSTGSQGNVTMSLYDVYGSVVKVIDAGALSSGNHELELSAAGLAPGMYILKVQASGEVFTKKVSIGR